MFRNILSSKFLQIINGLGDWLLYTPPGLTVINPTIYPESAFMCVFFVDLKIKSGYVPTQ